MEKIRMIIAHEYLTRVRSRFFIIATLISPLLFVVYLGLPFLLVARGGGERHIVVYDQSGDSLLYDMFTQKAMGASPGTKFDFKRISVDPEQNVDTIRREQNPEVAKNAEKGYIVFRSGILNGELPEYYGSSLTDLAIENLNTPLSNSVADRRLTQAGLDPGQFLSPIKMKMTKVTLSGESQEPGQNFLSTIIASYLIYMITFLSIIAYSATVMRGVVEEKQSRIIEVLLSSVRPFELMMGKLIGIGLVGLTQYACWVLSVVVLAIAGKSVLAQGYLSLPSLPYTAAFSFIIYFVLGYFVFASLYLITGSLVSDSDSSNPMARVVLFLSLFPIVTFMPVIKNPNSLMVIIMSEIPYFAPGLMVLRMTVTQLPSWQVPLSMALMVAAVVGSIWVAGKIYRIAILAYGNRPTMREMVRWLRYT